MAALGITSDSFFVVSVLTKLAQTKSEQTLPAFEKWIGTPDPRSMLVNEAAAAFKLAHIGLSRAGGIKGPAAPGLSIQDAAWSAWGSIFYWLHKDGLADEEISGLCREQFQLLQGPLLHAAIDPWFQMEVSRRNFEFDLPRTRADILAEELKALTECALPGWKLQTSIFPSAQVDLEHRAKFMIAELGRIGDGGTLALLEPLVDSEPFGAEATSAFRAIQERLLGVTGTQ